MATIDVSAWVVGSARFAEYVYIKRAVFSMSFCRCVLHIFDMIKMERYCALITRALSITILLFIGLGSKR